MARGQQILYPEDNDLLDRAIRAKGLGCVARELGIAEGSLRGHCVREGIATRMDPRVLPDDALKRLAESL